MPGIMAETPRPPDETEWITISEAVARSGKSERTIRRYVAEGLVTSKREGKRLLVSLPDLLKHVSPPDWSDESKPAAPTDLQAENRRLQAELDKSQALLQATAADRDYLRQALAAALNAQQTLLEAGPRRRWWWPWQRREPGE
jgi:hypothetical protein